MKNIIAYFKGRSIHTPKLAIVRFLLAFGVLLTQLSNNLDVIANHNYTHLKGYTIRHDRRHPMLFQGADLFMIMDPAKAKVVVILILLLVMSGFFPQVTGILHLWAGFSLHNYMIIYNGGDDLAFILSALLLPICLSDPRINTWKRKNIGPSSHNIMANIALIFIQIQAALLYFDACYAKMFTWQWKDGTAVYYYTSHYRLGAPDWLKHINELITLTPMVKLVTWGVLAFEMVMVFAIFLPSSIKRKLIIPALFFHFLIVINFGLITFFISITALILLYLDDQDYCLKLFARKKNAINPASAV